MSRHAIDAAIARLTASREQWRRELLPPTDAGHRPHGAAGALPRRLGALWRWWRRRLAATPVLGLAIEAVQTWWWSHPWRTTCELVAHELHANATLHIRRHPLAATLAAAGLGAALMIWKPWRWNLVRQHLRPRVAARWLLHQLAQPSVQAMLVGLLVSAGVSRAAQQAGAVKDNPDAFTEREPPTTSASPDLSTDDAANTPAHAR